MTEQDQFGTVEDFQRMLGRTANQEQVASPGEPTPEPDVPEISDTNDHVDEQQERDAEAAPVADTEPETQPLGDHQRQLQRLQEEHPANAAEIAALFGDPAQRQREHDWLMRLHQPPKDGAA